MGIFDNFLRSCVQDCIDARPARPVRVPIVTWDGKVKHYVASAEAGTCRTRCGLSIDDEFGGLRQAGREVSLRDCKRCSPGGPT